MKKDTKLNTKLDTKLVNAGRHKKFTGSAVNPSLVRASTIVFDSVAEMSEAARGRDDGVAYYGRRGTSTTFALSQAMIDLENAAGCYVYSCGTAAITSCLLSFLSAGDHLLMVDSVYEPTREFVDETLTRLQIETDYYDPLLGADIEHLIKSNTKVIFMESPGSLTMEVQDVPAISRVASAHGLVTMIDNTYATPFNFRPLDSGVDISIHSATKYLSGHSDVMLGVASANERTWRQLQKNSYQLGQCASVDDCYTTLRGLRTLPVRMRQHSENALKLASWLSSHSLVDHVRHPALPTCPGHESYSADFSGGNGLFSFVLKEFNTDALTKMLDSFSYFKLGFSWGGYESLVLSATHFSKRRTATDWHATGHLVRLHVGLEDFEDLQADLATGLNTFQDNL